MNRYPVIQVTSLGAYIHIHTVAHNESGPTNVGDGLDKNNPPDILAFKVKFTFVHNVVQCNFATG